MTMVRTKKSITGPFKNFIPQDTLRQLFFHIFMPFVKIDNNFETGINPVQEDRLTSPNTFMINR